MLQGGIRCVWSAAALTWGVLRLALLFVGYFMLSFCFSKLSLYLFSQAILSNKYLWLGAETIPHFFPLLSCLGNNYLPRACPPPLVPMAAF